MAFQSIPQSTFASGLGSSVGRGLAEQLPQQVERNVQSHKLQNLGENFSNLSPVEQISKLVAIPGMDAQKAMAFIPYLKEQQGRRALTQRAQETRGIGQPKPSAEKEGLGEFRKRMESKDFSTPAGNAELLNEAEKLRPLYPGESDEKLLSRAQAADQARLQRDAAISKRSTDTEEEFNKWLKNLTQKTENNKYADIIGEMQGDYLEEARNRALDEGISPITAAKDAAEDLLDFAKTRQKLKTTKPTFLKSGKTGPEALKDILNTRSEYSDREQLELFRDDLINNQKLSPEEADRLAFPVSQNTKSYISSLPEIGRNMRGIKKLSADEVKSIVDKMTRNDSARTIALELMGRGYNGNDFIQQAKRFKDDLSKRQSRDLETLSRRPSMGDIQLFGLGKLSKYWGTI